MEASYQDEFYRSLQQVLGFSAKVTSEWTGDKDNRIDFRIDEPRWGIELLRDATASVNTVTGLWEMGDIHCGSKMDHSRIGL